MFPCAGARAARAVQRPSARCSPAPWRPTCASMPSHHAAAPTTTPAQIADELIEEAKSMLSTYDPAKAAPLYALAEYIRSRKN